MDQLYFNNGYLIVRELQIYESKFYWLRGNGLPNGGSLS